LRAKLTIKTTGGEFGGKPVGTGVEIISVVQDHRYRNYLKPEL